MLHSLTTDAGSRFCCKRLLELVCESDCRIRFLPGFVGEQRFPREPSIPHAIPSIIRSIRRQSDFCNKIGTDRPFAALRRLSPLSEVLAPCRAKRGHARLCPKAVLDPAVWCTRWSGSTHYSRCRGARSEHFGGCRQLATQGSGKPNADATASRAPMLVGSPTYSATLRSDNFRSALTASHAQETQKPDTPRRPHQGQGFAEFGPARRQGTCQSSQR